MTHRQLKAGYFALAGLNTLAASYYFNYLFFFLRDHFGFGNCGNLWVTALSGLLYLLSAWPSGKFAARFGRRFSLKIGFFLLAVVMVASALVAADSTLLLVLVGVYSIVLLLTWPALEALVSERETQAGVQEMVGIYNCSWAGASAIAYFTGGKLYDALGSGAVFWLPAGIFLAQFFLVLWLDSRHDAVIAATPEPPKDGHHAPEASARNQPVSPQNFLRMAWLANPFAYIAINTLIAVMPGVAGKLALSPTQAGLFCSVWFFWPRRRVRTALEMARLALPFRLAAGGVPDAHRGVGGDFAGAAALAGRRGADFFRLCDRPDLLFVPFLFDGCG